MSPNNVLEAHVLCDINMHSINVLFCFVNCFIWHQTYNIFIDFLKYFLGSILIPMLSTQMQLIVQCYRINFGNNSNFAKIIKHFFNFNHHVKSCSVLSKKYLFNKEFKTSKTCKVKICIGLTIVLDSPFQLEALVKAFMRPMSHDNFFTQY